MRGKARHALAAIVLAILAVSAQVKAEDPIQILDIDTYERTIAPGQETVFNWTVRNLDPISYNITISTSQMAGWNVTITPASIVNLAQNRAAKVTVTVIAPDQVESATQFDLKVFFTVMQDGAVVFVGLHTATIHIPSIYAEKKVLGIFSNPLPPPLDNEWGVFLLDVIAWLIIALLTLLVIIPTVRKVGSLTKTHVDDIVIRIVRTPLVVLLFLYGTIQSLDTLDRHIDVWIRDTLSWIYQVALTLILLYLGYKLFKDVVVYIGKTVSSKTVTHVDDIVVPLVEKVGLVVIMLIGLGVMLGYLDVDLTLFVAGGVVVSMMLAFAAQDTISNFFSGIFLLTDRPFAEGDVVVMSDGDWVEVRRIGLRTTRLFRYSDASLVTVPNNTLVNDKIANFSNPKDKGRIMKTFNVGYGSDPVQVKNIIKEVIDENPNILKGDPYSPVIRFDAMGESSLDFFILVWIDDRKNRFAIQDYLNTEIYSRFNKAGIDIPFPQRTIHLKLEGGGAEPKKPAPPDIRRIVESAESRSRGDMPGIDDSGDGGQNDGAGV